MKSPKLFISYSWTDHSHEKWVIELATELMESGVDVLLDKWDLKEGNDAIVYMEKMVTDHEIHKVAIISDKLYASKADGRSGGVGTETTIISKEVYEKQEQNKFVVIVSEKDENGKPYLPTYYKSKIYIDLSEPDTYSENFELLLRWVFDKPLYIKPKIGNPPAFLEDSTPISLGTNTLYKRTLDAIKNNKSNAVGALREYLEMYTLNLEIFRITNFSENPDEDIINNINSFLPYRDELINILISVNQYSPNEINCNLFHKFFERLVPYLYRPSTITTYNDWFFDNYKFINHELFLYAISIFIKYENFSCATQLLTQKYYYSNNADYGRETMLKYDCFREPILSLNNRNARLGSKRLSIRADLLKDRCKKIPINFNELMQTDFLLFFRNELSKDDFWNKWYPETLVFLGNYHSPFEIFARSVSKNYFDKIKILLSVQSPSEFTSLFTQYKAGQRKLPRWEHYSLHMETLVNFDKLATEL